MFWLVGTDIAGVLVKIESWLLPQPANAKPVNAAA